MNNAGTNNPRKTDYGMNNPWRRDGRDDASPSAAQIACAEAQARLLAEWWNDAESNAANLSAIAYWLDKAGGRRPPRQAA